MHSLDKGSFFSNKCLFEIFIFFFKNEIFRLLLNRQPIKKSKHTLGCSFFYLRAIWTINSPKESSCKTLQEYMGLAYLNFKLVRYNESSFFSDTHPIKNPYLFLTHPSI